MMQNKNNKHKFLKFILPAILMLTGMVGMMFSSSVAGFAYNQDDYDLVYAKSGEFQYRNAAVKDLSDAMDAQLPK